MNDVAMILREIPSCDKSVRGEHRHGGCSLGESTAFIKDSRCQSTTGIDSRYVLEAVAP